MRDRDIKWARVVGLPISSPHGPFHGPFYWVRLPGGTVLRAAPVPIGSKSLDHSEFWRKIVVADVVPGFLVSVPFVARELENVPYAMDRGRVVFMRDPAGGPGEFVVYHQPRARLTDMQKKDVISVFGLNARFHAEQVHFMSDEHESRLLHDTLRFDALVGRKKRGGEGIVRP